jgi:putative sterol carrier protein
VSEQTFDPAALSPEDFAQLVATSGDDQLREVLSGSQREVALDEIFGRMETHFDPNAARGVDAVIHFLIGGRDDGSHDEFEVVIRDGACNAARGLNQADPRVSLQLDAVDFMRLITGNASGPGLFMAQKLRIKGDMMFAPQILGLFSLPTA